NVRHAARAGWRACGKEPVLGFDALTPAHWPLCSLLREAGGLGWGLPQARLGWISVVLRPPSQPFPRWGKGSSAASGSAPSPAHGDGSGRIGWGEQSEPQRSPRGKGRLAGLRQGPVLGFALLTPAYWLFCSFPACEGRAQGFTRAGAALRVRRVLRTPLRRRSAGAARVPAGG